MTFPQRVVRACPPLARWFWVPHGWRPSLPALAESAAGRGAGSTVEVIPVRPAPAEMRGQSGPAEGSDLFVAELRPGQVVGDAMLVATATGTVAGDVQALHGVTDPGGHWALRRCRYRREVRFAGSAALLAAASGNNYFHWLFESLPRLHLLERAGGGPGAVDRVLLNELQQPFHDQTLDLLGVPAAKRWRCAKARVFQFDRLVVPSMPWARSDPQRVPPWVGDFLRRRFLPLAQRPAMGTKVFVSRRRARGRTLVNETEIEELLRRAGFRTVCLEDLAFAEQVGLFAVAEAVVAVHGAGLANLVFSPPGTKVVEMFPPRYVNGCYEALAAAAGLVHAPLVGRSEPARRGRAEVDDVWIGPGDLRQALARVGL